LLVIEVPEPTTEGYVVLKTPQGDITTKTLLGITEPITIASISPGTARPGDVITIEGTYLNLVEQVVFSNLKAVTEFESQSQTSLQVRVPADAQTGIIILVDGEEIPNEIESTTELNVTLPVITAFSVNPVKTGSSLTVTGTDLDLAVSLEFAGGVRVDSADFTSVSSTEIVFNVPANINEGMVKVISGSSVASEFGTSLSLISPAVTGVTPNPAKPGQTVTITGTDLDLITGVSFGGDTQGTIEDGGSTTSIVVEVPEDAVDGTVTFTTEADQSVASPASVSMVVPTITAFTPASVATVDAPVVTITGTHLDIIKTIVFGGGWEADISKALSVSETEIVIPVTPGSVSGKLTIVATNEVEVTSTESLTIVPNVPNVTVVPTKALIGGYLTIEGTNMDVFSEMIFPGDIKATRFGAKTATTIQVFVTLEVTAGMGKIKFITSDNEVYESPAFEFGFGGVEPVLDPALVINDFSAGTDGHSLGWDNWGGALQELSSNPGPGISDNGNFVKGQATLSSWTWLWGCNHNQLPKPTVSKAGHVFKFDVQLTIPPPSDAVFKFRFNGTEVDLGNLGASTTPGWITLTWDLAEFGNLPDTIEGTGEWGLIYWSPGSSYDMTGFSADNFRFEEK
jgi:hypothetical protein